MTPHPEINQIKEYVAGQLDQAETDAMLEHLATCESCIELVDRFWAEAGIISTHHEIHNPDLEAWRSMYGGLMHRVHVYALGRQMFKLMLLGPIRVFSACLRIITAGPQARMKEESPNGSTNAG